MGYTVLGASYKIYKMKRNVLKSEGGHDIIDIAKVEGKGSFNHIYLS